MVDVKFSEKQSLALDLLEDDHTTEVFFGGGAGPGKSWLGCYWHIKNRLRYPGTRGVIGRSELKNLKESTKVTYLDVCHRLGLIAGVHYTENQQDSSVNWYNGSRTVFLDMKYYPRDPDYVRFGSTEYTDAFIDEAPEIEQRAFDILQSRLRYKLLEYNLIPKIFVTGNPGDHWIKHKFVKDRKGTMIVLRYDQARILATILDHIDPEFIKLYKSQLEKMSDYDKQRLLHGDWDAVPRTGLEYFPSYTSTKHVGTTIETAEGPKRIQQVTYLPAEPIHLAYDFNRNPYMTLICAQLLWRNSLWWLRIFDEFCLPHPLNKTKHVTEAFKTKYSSHTSGIFYYGDASGKTRDTRSDDDTEHDFSRVEEVLWNRLMDSSNRVLKSNPSIIARKEFIEDILQERLPIRIEIDEECYYVKGDFMYLKEGPDGKKLKEYSRDNKSGLSFQKYGHTSDALEYLAISAFSSHFESYLKRR